MEGVVAEAASENCIRVCTHARTHARAHTRTPAGVQAARESYRKKTTRFSSVDIRSCLHAAGAAFGSAKINDRRSLSTYHGPSPMPSAFVYQLLILCSGSHLISAARKTKRKLRLSAAKSVSQGHADNTKWKCGPRALAPPPESGVFSDPTSACHLPPVTVLSFASY